jgi:hypothetical protein
MTTLNEQATRIERRPVGAIARVARSIYLLCAGLFAAAIVVQVFLAGAGALVQSSYWAGHRAVGGTMPLLIIAMLLIGLFARLPWRLHALNALAFVLFAMQYIFLWLLPSVAPILRALHAVNALAIFALAVYLVRRAWQLTRDVTVG